MLHDLMLPKGARNPNAHSSGLTRSRCLASGASYWLVFMFSSTFLFTSLHVSALLRLSLCSPCPYSWSDRATGDGNASQLLGGFDSGPGSRNSWTAGDRSPVTLAQTKNPRVDATQRHAGSGHLIRLLPPPPRAPAAVISQQVWAGKVCLRLRHRGFFLMVEFKVSVVAFPPRL